MIDAYIQDHFAAALVYKGNTAAATLKISQNEQKEKTVLGICMLLLIGPVPAAIGRDARFWRVQLILLRASPDSTFKVLNSADLCALRNELNSRFTATPKMRFLL